MSEQYKDYVQFQIDGGRAAPEMDWTNEDQHPVDQMEPEDDRGSRVDEVLRGLADIWLEEPGTFNPVMVYVSELYRTSPINFEVLMARILFPSATWAEMPALMSKPVTRQGCHRAATRMAKAYPELDHILFPPFSGSKGQRARRAKEGREV